MTLCEGSTIDVVVRSVRDFGLLVKHGDLDGVILVTNLYWDCDGGHARMFREFVPGQQVRVKVLRVPPGQFSASIKDLHPEDDPWRDPGVYVEGSVHRGVVRFIFDSRAALVKIGNGADAAVDELRAGTALGDHIDVIVKAVDPDKKRILAEQLDRTR